MLTDNVRLGYHARLGLNGNPEGAETDEAETNVQIHLTLYGGVALAVLTTGLFALNDQHYLFGGVFTVSGRRPTCQGSRPCYF